MPQMKQKMQPHNLTPAIDHSWISREDVTSPTRRRAHRKQDVPNEQLHLSLRLIYNGNLIIFFGGGTTGRDIVYLFEDCTLEGAAYTEAEDLSEVEQAAGYEGVPDAGCQEKEN